MNRTHVLDNRLEERARTLEVLRKKMADIAPEAARGWEGVAPGEVVELMPELADLLPCGGLPRGMVSSLGESPLLAVRLIAYCSSRGGHVAIVGWPELSCAAMMEAGADLSKIVSVPSPEGDIFHIGALLAEGMDVVICRENPTAAGETLSPSRARSVQAKLRLTRAVLLSVGMRFPSTGLELSAQVCAFHGIGEGEGRVRGVDLEVSIRVRGRPAMTRLLRLGACGELDRKAPSASDGADALPLRSPTVVRA
ncbi:hypothetical protein L1O03_02135 [Corynebacterium uropygiale]|uniref:Uncharacterized protein n=1 Tax=Corynebacterium uropygiale TaxID=1775911 RepID=A0A9X1TYL7_9CORY|nr:hypothetical protein [Corynebacterium uropygiale]MCF4005976.1 hypothetical protein [Corynebacterium uropygiale]